MALHPQRLTVCLLILINFSCFAQSLIIITPSSLCSGAAFTATAIYTGTGTPATFSFAASSGLNAGTQTGSSLFYQTFGCGNATVFCTVFDSGNNLLATGLETLNINCGAISANASQSVLCGAGLVVLSASGAGNYSWSTGQTGPSTTLSLSQSTLISVSSAGAGCPATLSITVNQLQTNQSQYSVCPGSNCTLTAAGAPNYAWFQPPSNLLPNGTSAQVVVSPLSLPITYTVFGFYPNNCILTQTLQISAFNYIPQTTAPASVCPAKNTTLACLGATSYSWSLPGNNTVINIPISINQTVTTTYTLSADSTGCSGTKYLNVGLHSLPQIQIVADYDTLCNGQTTTVFASGATSYVWSLNPALMSSPYSNSVIVQPLATNIFTVTGTNTQGCQSSSAITIYFGTYPLVSLFKDKNAVCPGFLANCGASGAMQYFWKGTNLMPAVSAATIGLPAGAYTLIGSNGGSCTDSISFVVNALPPLSVSASASASFTCYDTKGLVWPVTLSTNGALNYSWTPYILGQMTNSLGATTVVTPSISTCYTLTAFNANCSGNAEICINVPGLCTGMMTADDVESKLKIFPMPVRNSFRLLISDQSLVTSINISDCFGRIIKTIQDETGLQNQEIDVNNLPSGYYVVSAITSHGTLRRQFIKE